MNVNPFCPIKNLKIELNSHYDVLDLENIPDDYLPRSNYVPACDAKTYAARVPRVSWSEPSDIGPMLPNPVTKPYRFAARLMVLPELKLLNKNI